MVGAVDEQVASTGAVAPDPPVVRRSMRVVRPVAVMPVAGEPASDLLESWSFMKLRIAM